MNSRVTLAANERPAINDVCASELRELLDELAKISMDTSLPPSPGLIELGAAWRSGQLRVASSGGDLPLIDLRAVGAEVQAAAAEADLVLLEGKSFYWCPLVLLGSYFLECAQKSLR